MDIYIKNRNKIRSLAAVLLTAVLMLGILPRDAAAASSAEIQKQIDSLEAQNKEIQQQINAIQRQYDANFHEMADIVARKEAIDQEITLLNNKIETTNQQITAYGQLIADTQDDLDDAEQELLELSQKHRERVRAMEEQGSLTYWQVLFQANSFTDLLDRINMVEEINAADRSRIEQMRIAADIVDATRLNLTAEKRSLEDVRTQLAADEAALEEKRTESDGLLYELEQKAEEFQILLDESELLQDELMQEIAQKEVELKEAKYDEYLAKLALQGENPPSNASWIMPVSGRLTSPFGMRVHPVLGYERFHEGVDMSAYTNTPIYAARSGKVTRAAYQDGGAGYYVNINHGDGFSSIYMHMTRYIVSSGQYVEQGQVIGYVGSTGLSTGPHLHFGIAKNGSYVNPMQYI